MVGVRLKLLLVRERLRYSNLRTRLIAAARRCRCEVKLVVFTRLDEKDRLSVVCLVLLAYTFSLVSFKRVREKNTLYIVLRVRDLKVVRARAWVLFRRGPQVLNELDYTWQM